jgi:hypothetical protein
MEPLDLDDAFDDFMRKVNPAVQKHEEQYRESRRVFFAGAAVLFFRMVDLATVPDADGFAELDNIKRQLEAFNTLVEGDRD